MRKLFQIVTLATILCTAGQNAGSQSLKLGYINRDELLRILPEYDSANAHLERIRKVLVDQLSAMQDEFSRKTTAFNNESKGLPDVVRKMREDELKDLSNRIQLFQVKANQQLNDKNTELIQPVLTKVDKTIKDVAREQNFTMVFDAAVVYYFDEKRTVNMLPLIKTKLGLK